jgi:hypothetical protein
MCEILFQSFALVINKIRREYKIERYEKSRKQVIYFSAETLAVEFQKVPHFLSLFSVN